MRAYQRYINRLKDTARTLSQELNWSQRKVDWLTKEKTFLAERNAQLYKENHRQAIELRDLRQKVESLERWNAFWQERAKKLEEELMF